MPTTVAKPTQTGFRPGLPGFLALCERIDFTPEPRPLMTRSRPAYCAFAPLRSSQFDREKD
jgi:hypothetical protein